MLCPKCKGKTEVTDTLKYLNGKALGSKHLIGGKIDIKESCVLRRRRCLKDSSHLFKTLEVETEFQ